MSRRYVMMTIYLVIIVIIGSLMVFRTMKEKQIYENELDRIHVTVDDQIYEGEGFFLRKDGRVYMRLNTLKDLIYDDYRISTSGLRILTTIRDKTFRLEDQYLTQFVKDVDFDLNFPIKRIDDTDYIDLEKLAPILNFTFQYAPLSKALLIDTDAYDPIFGTVIGSKIGLHQTSDRKSYRVKNLTEDERVKIYKEKGDWLKVRTQEGIVGYVQKKNVIDYVKESEVLDPLAQEREDFSKYHKINVTWDYVATYEAMPDLSDEKKIKGLDVICPTWFNLTQNGLIINNADLKYVQDAHMKGYEVWAVFKNDFDPDLTTGMLNDPILREKVIAQLLFYTAFYELDGINLDFENVYIADKKALVTFVKELDFYIEKQNLLLSMDVTVPWGSDRWSKFLDRPKLAKYVDYVMLMAYDEHWAASPVSGSVASIGWVERGVSESLEQIPKEKLILGVPFYTRIWTEENQDGAMKVSSKAIGMQYVDKYLSDKNEELKWDQNAGQFLAQFNEDEKTYKIWIEDDTSLKLKLELIDQYDIAGVASWRKGFESPEIWDLIYEVVKK